ncbi:serine/threonine-protein kinase [Nocardia bhagyanarayanae]|uniref:non-specific serine/threonine protein kinase n=1 Tax=Nocardia bhagyanarayanae TaxID=1215925 RepID=A0A543F3P3_9NOCA|nr:serine/threonine-protein kinase [Nocardia bhagyanarayanae]TQM28438.1 serine/threonine-protein kinase [Nocardia bhagyanarayanae]
MLQEGEVFAGYVIERQLGRGGMGSVYLARHPRLPRRTALKLLNREMFADNEIRARFEREADLVAQLDHPNIVTVYDRGIENSQLWISMQYVDGSDAAEADPNSLAPERAVRIVAETAKALDYAHGMGILHRDVKPANILLARAGVDQERVFLTDFGIARLRDDAGHLTQTGTFTATLTYASPEQLTGAPLDGRTDQYSLACTLYWLLAGVVPFDSTNPAVVIQGHLQQPPPPLSSLRHGLPAALDGVLARALSKRAEQRFGSCGEFAEAARQALAGVATGGAAVTPPQPYFAAGQAPMGHGPVAPAPNRVPMGNAPVAPAPSWAPMGHGHVLPARMAPGPGGGMMPIGALPQRRSPFVLLAVLAAVAVLAVGGVATAVALNSSKDPADVDLVHQEFPGMVPADRFDPGFRNAKCDKRTTRSTESSNMQQRPDFGSWTEAWFCYSGDGVGPNSLNPPYYEFYRYRSAADVRAVVAALPSNKRSEDAHGSKTYTNYTLDRQDAGFTYTRIVTVFTGDTDRETLLMYTHSMEGSLHLDLEGVRKWWREAPLS